MKKLIIVTAVLFLHFSLFSQDQNVEKKFSKSISVNIKNIDLRSNESRYDDFDSSYGIDLQGNINYKINRRWEMKTGLELSYLTAAYKSYNIIFHCDIWSLAGDEEMKSYQEITLDWYYLNIPIEFQYNILNEKNRIYVKGGLDNLFNVLKKSSSIIHECGNPIEGNLFYSAYQPKSFFGQVSFGVGLELPIHPKVKLIIEPNLEYGFSNVIDIPLVHGEEKKSRLLSFGIQTGIRF